MEDLIEERGINCVAITEQADLKPFHQVWLVEHHVLSKSSTGFFTPMVVQAQDEAIDLLILPDRIQIAARSVEDDLGAVAFDRMLKFIEASTSNALPIKSVGLNYSYVFAGGDKAALLSVEDAFLKTGGLWAQLEARSGSFSLVERADGVQHLVSVNTLAHQDGERRGVGCAFNFHMDVSDTSEGISFLGNSSDFALIAAERAMHVLKLLQPEGD